jgi:hypothetical protein
MLVPAEGHANAKDNLDSGYAGFDRASGGSGAGHQAVYAHAVDVKRAQWLAVWRWMVPIENFGRSGQRDG